MIGLWSAVLFIGGLLVGSFLNVVILRYDPEGSLFSFRRLSGRSACLRCGRTLSAGELIPLMSYLFLWGKCKTCKNPISIQYPIVEFLSGVIFVSVPLFLNGFYGISNLAFFNGLTGGLYYFLVAFWILVFLLWLVMSVIDIREYLIPDEIVIGIAALGIPIAVLTAAHPGMIPAFRDSFVAQYVLLFPVISGIIVNHLFSIAVAGGIFYILYVLSRGRAMGFGDVKLALASGILFGWPDIILVIALSFVLGGIAGGISIARKKATMKDVVPFAPFFVGGCILTVFFGREMIELYFKIFSLGS